MKLRYTSYETVGNDILNKLNETPVMVGGRITTPTGLPAGWSPFDIHMMANGYDRSDGALCGGPIAYGDGISLYDISCPDCLRIIDSERKETV